MPMIVAARDCNKKSIKQPMELRAITKILLFFLFIPFNFLFIHLY